MTNKIEDQHMIELTAEIVAAYVSHNPVPHSELANLIGNIHKSLGNLAGEPAAPVPEAPTPAVAIKKSVQDDHIVCLEDGKKFKSLKRHLATSHGLTPEEYRQKWNLSSDYPMVAPAYAETRSKLAKTIGLGRKAKPVEPVRGAGRKRAAKG